MKNVSCLIAALCFPLLLLAALPKSAFADSPGEASKAIPPEIIKLLGPHLQDGLKDAQEIRLYERLNTGYWSTIPLAVLSETSNPHMFHLLKGTTVYRRGACTCIDFYLVSFFKDDKLIAAASYYPDRGVLEDQNQQVKMPPELAVWFRSQIPTPLSQPGSPSPFLIDNFNAFSVRRSDRP